MDNVINEIPAPNIICFSSRTIRLDSSNIILTNSAQIVEDLLNFLLSLQDRVKDLEAEVKKLKEKPKEDKPKEDKPKGK